MPLPRAWQLWRDDEEMAKKDDDLSLPRYSKHCSRAATRKVSRAPRRSWVRRITVYGLVMAALFFLLSRSGDSLSIPASNTFSAPWDDSDPVAMAYERRFRPTFGPGTGAPPAGDAATDQGSSRPAQGPAGQQQQALGNNVAGGSLGRRPKYDGPVHFPALSSTLDAVAERGGRSRMNRNVLFAAASLESVSTLLPMACEMAAERQNRVHFAYMGVDDISVKDLLEMNGIDKHSGLLTHDARPDHFDSSTEARTQTAMTVAFDHINKSMHPQAVVVDSSTAEEDYFLAAARDQVSSTKAALIELPERPRKSLAWISRLDSSALAAWNKVRFDILIRATPTKTANLERLLKSIAKADLAGIQTPCITVDVPNVMEKSSESLLTHFKWPRPTTRGRQQPQMISLRRRVSPEPLDEEDSSVRFVESFWPTDPLTSHVLVLSPHTEVTPQFFQYVKYSVLHQLHSGKPVMAHDDDDDDDDYNDDGKPLMGLSFSIPRTLLDGTTAFSPPGLEGGDENDEKHASGQTAFLWQRPNSDAMLFTGRKWIELHRFISQTLQQKKAMSSPPALLTERTAAKTYPAWLESALQLARLRGYHILYPSQETADAILGVHSEVPDPPEEYQKDAASRAALASLKDESESESGERFDPDAAIDVLGTLPDEGKLPSPAKLPLLSWDGTPTTRNNLAKEADKYAALFRREVGGCTDGGGLVRAKVDARDLFCRKRGKSGQ